MPHAAIAVNGAMALRGVPADYDEWVERGNDAWGWQDVLPYFRKLESDQNEGGDLHGANGPIPVRRWQPHELLPQQQAFVQACRALGVPETADHNSPDSTGVGSWPMNIRDGIRVSTAIGYLLPARQRLNLIIKPLCLVNRVLIEDGRALGVEVLSGGVLQRVYGQRITLSAGSIISPAILLRSGIGPRAELERLDIPVERELAGVGNNLIDHPSVGVFLVPKPGIAAKGQPVVQMGMRYTAGGSDEFNDMQMYMVGQADLTEMPALLEIIGAPMVMSISPVLQRPHSRGRLVLESTDPSVQPRIELHYLDDPEDMRRMVDGLRFAWRLAMSLPLAALTERIALLTDETMANDEAIEGYVRMTAGTLYHPVGTARMGLAEDETAVVDQYCRVHGVENLRVVDASVMPNIVRCNTNLTCIMIGERVADWMRSEQPAAAALAV